MEIGIVGLGKMGMNMAIRLIGRGHVVSGTARSAQTLEKLEAEGGKPCRELEDLRDSLAPPRIVWVMVPAGPTTDSIVDRLSTILAEGDLIVDGGNSNYRDSIRRGDDVRRKGIGFLDAGTSGGVWGLENGYCLMVGGEGEDFRRAEPIFRDLAPPDGYLHTGPAGSGHFSKMVHNGIEYGMMQAYGEGFEILARSRFAYDLRAISHLWNRGSVVRSWLLELAESAFAREPRLESVRDYVEDSGEGRWTVQEAMDLDVPAPVLTLALQARLASRQESSFSAKVAAALRREFGGHAIRKSE